MTCFQQLGDGLAIMTALDRRRSGVDKIVEVVWEELSPHVIDKGPVKVFPIAGVVGGDDADREAFFRVSTDLERDGIHFFGGDHFHAETLISPEEGYGRRLAQVGIHPDSRSYAWRVRDYAAVFVRTTNTEPWTLSLHVMPAEWVWPRLGNSDAKREQSRRRKNEKLLASADPRWDWPTS